MRLPLLRLGLLASSLALLAPRAQGDDIVLTGGSRLTGVVLERGAERVHVLLPSGGELDLAAADVKEVVADADAPAGSKVVRYVTGKDAKVEGLQTALIHYVHPTTGQRVDLVGAVHIADMAYYREVQRLLEAADLVLYELVKDEDGPAPDEASEPNAVRDFQVKMAGWFGFAFQLHGIAYDRPHFVHADMTVEQFRAAAEKTGATGLVEMLGKGKPAEAKTAAPPVAPAPPANAATPPAPAPGPAPKADGACPGSGEAPAPAPAPQAKPEPAPAPAPAAAAEPPTAPKAPGGLASIEGQVKMLETMLKAMGIEDPKRGPQVRKTVKGFLGRMMGSMGAQMGSLLGSATTELLIVKRNEVAIERLKEVPASAKSVAIFYGAAHLPDLETRIEALGYKRVGARWLLAWDMR